jgi:hypothetical protein
MAKAIDKKWLEGTAFRYSESEEVVKDGRKTKQYVLKERPLTPDDVLDWKETADTVVFVTGDGQKITVDKTKGKAEGKAKE